GRGLSEIERHPTGNPTFLVVFGIGLGHHLPRLARETKARWLILVEPSPGFIEHSFQALDWPELLAHFDAGGGGVRVVAEADPSRMVGAIVAEIARHGIPFVDGAWVFVHYPLWSFSEARAKLHEAIQFAFVNRGFFEDELRMMTNAVANFTARPFWLIEGRPRLQRPATAVIVGAGPSLDEALETLHRIRDRVVLFSGGTALKPLLRNGIVPDFHCELENVPEVVDVLTAASAHGDLSRIKLIASATVDPRVPPMFGEAFFFFRDSVSSTKLLGSKFRTLQGAAPTCVNTAFASAIMLGFTEFAFFGTDCGFRPGGNHHASGTVYRDVGLYKESADRRAKNPLEVEANFGGVALTDWVYDACRRMLGEAIQAYGLSPVNTSDGALIPGTRPMVPEAVEVETPPVDRASMIEALRQSMQRFAAHEILREHDFTAFVGRTRSLYRAIAEMLDGFDPEAADFGGVYKAVKDFLATADRGYESADSMMNGTLVALPRIGMFYGYRVAEGELRRALFEIFMREMRAILAEMERGTVALFERLATATVATAA
ncbi:MAG: motility associated factor glycosyltransferase family protein, partial [Acidobacteriota bacterium]